MAPDPTPSRQDLAPLEQALADLQIALRLALTNVAAARYWNGYLGASLPFLDTQLSVVQLTLDQAYDRAKQLIPLQVPRDTPTPAPEPPIFGPPEP